MGPVLVEEQPFVHVVSSDRAVTVCAHCMRSSVKPLSRCSRCRFAHYCGSQCQKAGWTDHKGECTSLVRCSPRVPKAMARLMCRAILKKDRWEEPAFNGRTFSSLVSHVNDIRRDPEKSEFFVSLSHVLYEYMGGDSVLPAAELLQLFGQVTVNVFTISNEDLNSIGLGLYLGLSALDHSCDPDAFVMFDGKKAVLRSLKNEITKYDNQLRISYCDLLDVRSARHLQLRQQFFFTCNCPVCNDDERERVALSVRCERCDEGYCPLDRNKSGLVCWSCAAICSLRVEDAVSLMQRIDWKVHELANEEVHSIEEAKKLFSEAETVLSPLNIPLCHLADRITSWAIDNCDYRLASDFIEKTISCFKWFYPNAHPSLSLQYFKAGKLHALSDLRLELAASRLEQAVGSLHSSHGVQHTLSAEAHELLSRVQQQRRDLRNQMLDRQ